MELRVLKFTNCIEGLSIRLFLEAKTEKFPVSNIGNTLCKLVYIILLKKDVNSVCKVKMYTMLFGIMMSVITFLFANFTYAKNN